MKTIGEIRRENLGVLRAKHGSWAALNRALGRNERDATLQQVWNRSPDSKSGSPRKMGDPLARAIEASFGLEVGSMDKEGGVGGNPTAPVPERAQQLARHILDAASDGRLTPESFEFLEKALQMAARENREQSSSTQPANKKTARGV